MRRGNWMVMGVALLAGAAFAENVTLCVGSSAIVDGGVVEETFIPDVPVGATVTGVRVSLDVSHEWIGDLVIEVEHEGVARTLLDRPGSDVFALGCGGEVIDAVFVDAPEGSALGACVPGNSSVVGDVAPVESLGVFAGQEAGGAWVVRVRDVQAFDAGVVNGVCVEIDFESPAVCAGDCDGSGVVDFNDLVSMLFEFGGSPSDASCDADGSGGVDFNDLVSALFVFGACP